jgi:hypothetical protein
LLYKVAKHLEFLVLNIVSIWRQRVIAENIFLIAATESLFALKLHTETFLRRICAIYARRLQLCSVMVGCRSQPVEVLRERPFLAECRP